jgi:hypothetical protein
MTHQSLKLIEFGLGGVMTIPAKQRERAARLFLMASDAYARGEPKLAELLIEESNECADQAAGVWTQRQQKDELRYVRSNSDWATIGPSTRN